jgi:hypothetical protein
MRVPLALVATMLIAGAAAAQQPTTKATSAKADKQICKRDAPIGSMIPTRKECHTRAEWDQIARDNRANAQSDAERRMGAGAPPQ